MAIADTHMLAGAVRLLPDVSESVWQAEQSLTDATAHLDDDWRRYHPAVAAHLKATLVQLDAVKAALKLPVQP